MRRKIDKPILVITLILVLAGLLAIASASIVISNKYFNTPYYYLLRHGAAVLVGLVALGFTQRIPYRIWEKVSLPLLIISLLLVAAVFFPQLGVTSGGASRWVHIGPFGFQPSEILKLSLILYLAGWLAKKREQVKGFASTFLPFVVVMGVVTTLLVLEPDIGTLVVIAGSAVMLYFLGGGRISQLGALAVLAAVGMVIIVQIAPYRINRFLTFWNPTLDPQGIGYHINQSLIAIGSGGFWGRGYGQSIQKYNYLPEPIGDSIFAVIIEELGFLGGVIIVILFFLFFLRCMMIARRAPDFFGKLVVAGVSSLITFQALINMAAISGVLPLTGIPVPLISYGGTSIVMTLAMIGVVLNISKYA